MCSHYQLIKEQERYRRYFGVDPAPERGRYDMWPGYEGVFIRAHPHADAQDDSVPAMEAVNGLFGLVPHWSTDTKITKSTYNARSETVAQKPSFREVYKRNQRCIVPADAFFEPDWRSGKAVATRIESSDGSPLGIAGLWSSWQSAKGDLVHSYTMLTINAQHHPLMNHFHKPTDEKRMVVILSPERYKDWLDFKSDVSDFLLPYPAERLHASITGPAQETVLM
jgi:putative SOS response-associated peptidase YedK